MKKLVKKLSVVLIIVIMIILTSKVTANQSLEPVPNINKTENWIWYIIGILRIVLLLINLVLIVKSIIKTIKIKNMKTKIKYFIYIVLVALLVILAHWTFNIIINLATGMPKSAKGELCALLVLYTIPTILNIILYTRINKKSKKLKEGGESKCQE